MQIIGAGFTEKLQIVTMSSRNEFVKIEWLVDFTQIVMQKHFVLLLYYPLELDPERSDVRVRNNSGLCKEFQYRTRPLCLFRRTSASHGVKADDAAGEIAQVISRVGVIANVRDTMRRHELVAECENALSGQGRNP